MVESPGYASGDLSSYKKVEHSREDDDDNGNAGAAVLPVPVLVGTYQSEDKNLQAALTSCLILNELKTVGGLIDLFTALGAHGGCITAGDGDDNRDKNHGDDDGVGGSRWGSTTTTAAGAMDLDLDDNKSTTATGFYCTTASEQLKRGGGGQGVVADPGLFVSLGAWLRREHGVIVRKARDGLAVLDGEGG